VGPKQREFSVKDRDEFEFKPQIILLDIVQIYLHLEDCDRFCMAVLSDERSFSDKLLQQAAGVLHKVSQSPQINTDFMTFQEKIKVRMSALMPKCSRIFNVKEGEEEEEDKLSFPANHVQMNTRNLPHMALWTR
jgi:hypothetical protein